MSDKTRKKSASDSQVEFLRSNDNFTYIASKSDYTETRFGRSMTVTDSFRNGRSRNPSFISITNRPTEIEPAPSCIVAGSYVNTSHRLAITSSLSSESVVNVDISDLNGDEEVLATTFSLRTCKQAVLRPYKQLQLLIGWRPFRRESVTAHYYFWKCVNIIYPLLVAGLIIFYDCLEVLTCQGKLNLIHDIEPIPTKPPHPVIPGNQTTTYNGHLLNGSRNLTSPIINYRMHTCDHLIPTYVLPSLLHFASFAYGFYHFRIQENEMLYSLMERVFIRSRNSIGAQAILIRNARILRNGLILWLSLHFALEGLYNLAYENEITVLERVFGNASCPLIVFMLILKILGLLLVHGVNIAIILNYSIQCEMLVMYIRAIGLWLREKTVDLKQVMREILGVREFISILNGTMGKMTGLCIANYLETTIIGLCLLLLNKDDYGAIWAYRASYLCVWLISVIVPLVQAARVSKRGQKLRQVSFEMRVFGYQNASQLELDSFILFINSATLRAKLFGVAIRPVLLLLAFGGLIFILLLLLIAEVVSFGSYRQLF